MSEVIEHLNDAALVLGYVTLFGWMILIIWMAIAFAQEVRFNRQKKRRDRRAKQEWDRARQERLLYAAHDAAFVLRLGDPLQHHRGGDEPQTRPYLEVVNTYHEEPERERPQRNQGR